MKPKSFATRLKKTGVALGLVAAGLLGAASPASATEPAFFGWLGGEWTPFLTSYQAFVQEVDNQFYAINTYLSDIYTYMASGEGDTGTGIIGAINGNMNKIWAEQRPYMENMTGQQSSWERRNMLDGLSGAAILARTADPRNCSELPAAAGARMAGGGGSARPSKGGTEARLAVQQGGSKTSDLAYANDAYLAHKAGGYCSAEDARFPHDRSVRNAGGCSDADVHKMPDGDSRVQSIFRPAHDYADAAAVKKYGTSLTYNLGRSSPLPIGDQAKAAEDAIATMVSRFSPPSLPKSVEETAAGKVLMTKIKVFNSRISPAIDFLTTSKSRLDVAQSTLPAAVLAEMLSDFKEVYARLFPGSDVPENVSDAEVMRYEVLRRYADPEGDWTTTLTSTGDAAKVGQIQAQNQAVELYLLYNMHERQLETNALLSALVAQSVNPITRAEIEAAAIKIGR